MKFSAVLLVCGLAMASAQVTTDTYGWTPPPTTPAPTVKPPTTPAPTVKPPTTPAPTVKPPPGTPSPTTPGGKGDPIMTGLDGRSFEFFGKPGSTYNVLSEKSQQLSMTLKEGAMWDHTGTYMTALGFRYLEHTVEVSESAEGLQVKLDGKALSLLPSQTEQEVILGMAQGELSLLWQLHRADYGQAVEITTDLVQIVAWVTPAGTRDEGGKVQPSYLNFDLTLLATPAHNTLEGIIGRTYADATSNTEAAENDFKFHGAEATYEMASLFETAHPTSVFGKASGGKAARLLMEGASVTFPLKASSRGPALRASGRGLVGRKELA